MSILDQQQLANLCRVLSFSLSDLESVEERSTCEFNYRINFYIYIFNKLPVDIDKNLKMSL